MWFAPITSRREIERFAVLADADVLVYDEGAELGSELATALAPMPAYGLNELVARHGGFAVCDW